MRPGEVRPVHGTLALATGRRRTTLTVRNTADRPIGVGSHFPFAGVNSALELDRGAAAGMRLDVPAGEIVWFEPRYERLVTLVSMVADEERE